MFRLLAELKRRRVYQVAVAYLVGSFALLEAADLVLPAFSASAWIYRALVIAVLAGFPVALLLSWVFDITPEGVVRDGSPEPLGEGVSRRTGPLLVATLLFAVVGVVAWMVGRDPAAPAPAPGSAALAVLPFAPAAPDPALERLGRDLVITLSSRLTEIAGVTTAEPLAVLSITDAEEAGPSLARAGEVATALGASRLLRGSLVATGEGVRLDLGLHDAADMRRLGTASVTADRVDALTDSATMAVLRILWRDDPDAAEAAAPSPAAISTRSLEALRAYLDGERAVAEGRWREAPEAFARAIAADSTFWFAYWRLQYALDYHGTPVDSLVRARAWDHRREMPDKDRLLMEARAARLTEAVDLLREATTRFPSYWPAWWDLSELLVHSGGYLGHTLPESRAALERTLALNPRFTSAWSHLFWVARDRRDAEAMRRIIDELSTARYDRTSLQEGGINSLAFYRAQLALVEAEDGIPAAVVEEGVEEISGYRGPIDPASIASSLGAAGFLRAQIRLAREILAREVASPPMRTAQHYALAHALAATGVWDEALAEAEAAAAGASGPRDLLLPYRIGVVGAWLGAVEPGTVAALRPRLPATPPPSPEAVAELAWLDGLLAAARGDRDGLADARATLSGNGGAWDARLDASLAAFDLALSGRAREAGERMAREEREIAAERLNLALGRAHPFLSGVDRLAAAGWLAAEGDSLAAQRLLPWYEAVIPGDGYEMALANQVLATPALRIRAEFARAAGQVREAEQLEALLEERSGRPLPPSGAAPDP